MSSYTPLRAKLIKKETNRLNKSKSPLKIEKIDSGTLKLFEIRLKSVN